MTVLHISNKPVYPLVDGGCVAMSKTLEGLRQVADTVHHIAIHTPKHPFTEGAYPEDIPWAMPPEKTFIDTSIRRSAALLSLLTGINYNLQRFYSKAFEDRLLEFLRANPVDFVVLESLFLAPYLRVIRSISTAKVIVRTHNVEHELWQQQAREASGLKKFYLRSLAKSLKREEYVLLNIADKIWAITEEDAGRFREWGVEKPIAVIPVAMEPAATRPDYATNDCFNLGSLNWAPNQLAVERLTDRIWPSVHANSKNTLHIAGSFAESVSVRRQEGVVFQGFVEDAAAFMRTHGTLVAPVETGSGVRIKLLEAMSLGVPCISTALGATGIDPNLSGVRIAETDAEWIAAITEFSGSETLRRESGEKVRDYIRKTHSFTAVNDQMLASLGN
jgi:polysaccharide biosynthesis protein PslH